jgi:hypothetical protein
MARLEEYVLPVRQMTRDAFAKGHPYPFLLWQHAPADETPEWSFKTQTTSSGRASIARLIHEGLELAPEVSRHEAFPVFKTQNNPWKDRISVGRARNNDIVLLDNSVSKLHGHFNFEARTWTVADAGSRNGTRLNQAPLGNGEVLVIKNGDTVTFGRVDTLFVDAEGLYDFLSKHMTRRT